MLCCAQGRQGGGKTRFMTILGLFLHNYTKMPLYSNYTLYGINYFPVNSLKEIWQINSGILLLDELWLSADSRRSSHNVDFSSLIAQLRKKNIIAIYTSQQISKLDLRVRDATDFLFHCEDGNKITFVDYQYQTILRKYELGEIDYFNQFYDTYQPMQLMDMKGL